MAPWPERSRWARWLLRLTACFALLLASAVLRAGEQSPQVIAAPAATTDRATLDRYCVTCHNSRTRTGGLALDTVDVAQVAQDAETWEKVVRKVRGRMMPPPGTPRPDEATTTHWRRISKARSIARPRRVQILDAPRRSGV